MQDDGLDPDAAAHLERLRAAGPPADDGTPETARALHAAAAPGLSGPGQPVEQVRDHVVAGVPVRAHVPPGARGTTVYLHGGGWVVGSLDTFEPLCRDLALASRSTVLAVDYGLAPELRHPGQLRQVLAVLGALDGGPVALAGDSAGGHLAALAAATTDRPLAGLALVYPVVSPALDLPSARDNATGYGLTTEAMHWFWRQYLPTDDLPPDDLPDDDLPDDPAPDDAPHDLLACDLAGLPPTLVLTAGKDPLRDEGLALADAVERSGVAVRRAPYDGQIHGFFRMTAVVGQARQAQQVVGRFLAEVLG